MEITQEEQVHIDTVITVKMAMKKIKELKSENKIEDAIKMAKQILKVVPEYELGKQVFQELKDQKTQNLIAEAQVLVEQALVKAGTLLKEGSYMEAEVFLHQILRIDPDNEKAYELIGICSNLKREFIKGLEYIKKSIEINPNNALNYHNLGSCYANMGEIELCYEAFEKAITLEPDNLMYLNDYAVQCRCFGDYDKAVALLEEKLKTVENANLLSNLAGIYAEMHNLDKSLELFLKAEELDSNNGSVQIGLASTYFYRKEWDKAWKTYESRFDAFTHLDTYRKAYELTKKWDGKKDLNGKRLLVFCEQGAGDTIMMLRYLKYLKEKGAIILTHCSPKMSKIIEKTGLISEILAKEVIKLGKKGETLPDHDYHVSMMSLPHLLNKPIPEPEVYVLQDRTANFEAYEGFIKIAICFTGSILHPNDAKRSCKLKYFKKLQEIPNVKLFSLNMGSTIRKYTHMKEEVNYVEECDHMGVIDMSIFLNDLDDVSAILNSVDYLVTVDTAPLHLAGAMGKKVYAALPFNPDWRWQLSGEDTPWYPHVKLFRQPTLGDWESVFEKIKTKLHEDILSNQ